jgi:carbamoyl-phosphate synthase small subunit
MNGVIYLEDGSSFFGKGFGGKGTEVGEIVFNTSMTGYQEILTDPSYSHQILTMTYPMQGNYGTNRLSMQSDKISAKGLLIKHLSMHPSNFTNEDNLSNFLKKNNVIGIHDLDTREITKHIRETGTLKCVISNDGTSIKDLNNILVQSKLTYDWMKTEGVKTTQSIHGNGHHIGIIDYGIKNSIVDCFVKRNCKITLFPYKTDFN